MTSLRVLSVASEIYPIIKTGGLADVAGALPIALRAEGVEMRTLVPGYPDVLNALAKAEGVLEWQQFFGGTIRLLSGSCGELDLFVLDAPHLFARPGNPYLSPEGKDWPDNGLRFAALSRMAANIGLGAVQDFVPDVVHAHDWQAALTPAYLHYSGRPRPRTMITVHNLAFQGRFPQSMLAEIGLPPDSFNMYGVEYYGDIGFLKAGLRFADIITTVSPTYAVEIQSDEGSMGLGGLLRDRSGDLRGILNGIDTNVWNPATDPAIASRYDAGDLDSRAANKSALQRRFGLEQRPDTFLLGVISRLSWQKGLDLLLEAIPTVLADDMQLAVLGSGDADLQERYRAAAQANGGKIGAVIGYDEELAHQIQAGSDALIVPSRFEPCGLTQLCALRYGAVPIVSRMGGLEDTVTEADTAAIASGAATGFKFAPVTTDNLAAALRRAHAVFGDGPTWRTIQDNGMRTDVSWRDRARRYADLYREMIALAPA
ncbi:MAG TPA: glycogen synthase GlgA [Bradyrhizobium sp.]|uniref:glycogen synthase GlgA n=1 Tax=Bradyrhizobium sp. TaxID=376 RepID=UPI002C842A17|nr:glycogen synthase GlgA [Bradyrhizobium sp.]HLZ06041.1 glycogen synthase GlgA [Bradyrhizobium sp.]